MDTDQHILPVADIAAHERHVRLLVQLVLEHMDLEFPIFGRQLCRSSRLTNDSVRIRY